MKSIPKVNDVLDQDHLDFLKIFSKSCRHSIIAMLKNSQSGHPGGSLSCIDYLSLIHCFILSQTGEKIVVSNGHISPAVYSILAELGFIEKEDVIENFRKIGSVFEGHVTRHVRGVHFGTGPLGIGVSAASGFSFANQLKGNQEKVFALLGDGEMQEGIVYEMMHFAHKYKQDNLILFLDYNQVQLSDSLAEIMPINPHKIFESANWEVMDVDGHDYQDMWSKLAQAYEVKGKPVILIGNTIMGKGVEYMEESGRQRKADWHGKAPKPEKCDEILETLLISQEEKTILESFKKMIKVIPDEVELTESLTSVSIDKGNPILYSADELTDCRGAYGKALLDLAKNNENILALTADLGGSVKTDGVKKEIPERHIECGVAEQNMVSLSGGLSLSGYIPFCSTFGAFMTSRAKDQARVNDINQTNVKMVATHCGLSVGEDGPTHQAIDDMGSFLGLFNTMVMEPADPNQCDRMIRYAASMYGNFYIRMGRHKVPVLTKEDGSILFDEKYEYEYGKCDRLREGNDMTLVASGPMVSLALEAWNNLKEQQKDLSIDLMIASSPKKFGEVLKESIKKTQKVIVVEDHNIYSGFGGQVSRMILNEGISVSDFKILGVDQYQLSGKALELYDSAGISSKDIEKECLKMI